MLARRRQSADESGETLIELIVSITILGIVAVALATGITVSVIVSDQARKQTTASAFLHNYAETLQSSSLYQPCSAAPNYVALASLAAPGGFSAPTQSIKYWSGTAWTSSCPSPDLGLEQVTLTLKSLDVRATESLVVVVRQS